MLSKTKPAAAPPLPPTDAVILPAWWPAAKQTAEAELERVISGRAFRAEPVAFEPPGAVCFHVWDRVLGNARAKFDARSYFEAVDGAEPTPGAFPRAVRLYLAQWLEKPDLDGKPPPGPPPTINLYAVIRTPHGWQVRTYSVSPEQLGALAGHETGRSGEMHRSELCALIEADISALPNDALRERA